MASHVGGTAYPLAPGRGHPARLPRRPAATFPNPYVPTHAPPGTYDPALEGQRENANQGYAWAAQDFGTGNTQRQNDLYGDPAYGTAGALASILQAYGQRVGEANLAHTNETTDLTKSYANLASSQSDAQARAGVDMGGAVAQAAQKRAANQGVAQGRIDQSWRTLVGDNGQGGTLGYGRDQALGAARQAFDRANSGAATEFQRAGVTNALFNGQLTAEEIYQAQQAGLLPTNEPARLTRPQLGRRLQASIYSQHGHIRG